MGADNHAMAKQEMIYDIFLERDDKQCLNTKNRFWIRDDVQLNML